MTLRINGNRSPFRQSCAPGMVSGAVFSSAMSSFEVAASRASCLAIAARRSGLGAPPRARIRATSRRPARINKNSTNAFHGNGPLLVEMNVQLGRARAVLVPEFSIYFPAWRYTKHAQTGTMPPIFEKKYCHGDFARKNRKSAEMKVGQSMRIELRRNWLTHDASEEQLQREPHLARWSIGNANLSRSLRSSA